MRAMATLPLLALALVAVPPAALADGKDVRKACRERQGLLDNLAVYRNAKPTFDRMLKEAKEAALQADEGPKRAAALRRYWQYRRCFGGFDEGARKMERKLAACDRELDQQVEKFVADALAGPVRRPSPLTREERIRRAQRLPAEEPAARPTGRRVYRGPLPLDVLFSWAKLRGQSRPVTLVIDTTKGTATISPKEHVDRTPTSGLVGHRTVAFTPGAVDGTGVARGRWIYVHRFGNLRQQHVPPRLTHTIRREADWRAQPVPGTDGRAYDLSVEATKRVPRRRLCRLNLVE